jgi:hypothetical protein
VRGHWREIHYWLWLWQKRVPFAVKATVLGVLVCALLTAGLGAAGGLTSAGAGGEELAPRTTLERLVTVREKGRVFQRLVRVAVKAPEPGRRGESVLTQLEFVTRVVSLAAQAPHRIVVVTTVRPLTAEGKPQTVTRLKPRTRTETAAVTRTVTNTQNITQPPETVTREQTNTLTRTETRAETSTRVETQTLTETRVETVTLPPQTVTVLETVTVTVPKPK